MPPPTPGSHKDLEHKLRCSSCQGERELLNSLQTVLPSEKPKGVPTLGWIFLFNYILHAKLGGGDDKIRLLLFISTLEENPKHRNSLGLVYYILLF